MIISQALFDFLRGHRGLPIRSMAVFNFLLEATLAGSLLIVVGLVIRRFFRGKLGSRAIYFAWLLIALRLLAPIALPNPVMNELRPTHSTDLGARPIADQIRVRFQDSMMDLSRQLWGNTLPGYRETYNMSWFLQDVGSYTSYGWTGKWMLFGYLGVAGLVLVYMMVQNIRFSRRLRKNRFSPLSGQDQDLYLSLCRQLKVKPIPVFWVDPLPGPCLAGVFRPFIALPLDTPPDRLPHALMHELCHHKAHDGLWGLIRNACCIVHWFNPIVWYGARQVRIDCELACDDRVTAALGADGKAAYANALVQDAAQKNAPGLTVVATGMTMKGRHMKKRLTAILRSRQVKRRSLIVFGLLALIALALAFATAERYAPDYDMELDKSIYKWILDDPYPLDLPHMKPLEARGIVTGEDAANFASVFVSSPYADIAIAADGVYVAQDGDQWTVAMPTADPSVELRFTNEGHVFFFSTCLDWGNPWGLAVNEPGKIRDSARKAVDAYVRAFARDCLQGLEIGAVLIEEDLYSQAGRYFNCWVLNAEGESAASLLVQVAPQLCVKQAALRGGGSAGVDMAVEGILTPVDVSILQPVWPLDAGDWEHAAVLREMEIEKGPMHTWSLEDKLIISEVYRLPTDRDMDEATAIAKAKEAVVNAYGLESQDIDNCIAYVWFERNGRPEAAGTEGYCYRVNFGTVDREQIWGAVIMSDTGDVIETFSNIPGQGNSNG